MRKENRSCVSTEAKIPIVRTGYTEPPAQVYTGSNYYNFLFLV